MTLLATGFVLYTDDYVIAGILPELAADLGISESYAGQLQTLSSGPILLGLLANCALMTGSIMMLTYLSSYLDATSSAGVNVRVFSFSLSGVAGIVGLWLGGIASDRWGQAIP